MKIDNTINIKILGTDCVKLDDKILQSGTLSLQEIVARELYNILKARFEPIQPYINPTPSWPVWKDPNWINPDIYTRDGTGKPPPIHPVTTS